MRTLRGSKLGQDSNPSLGAQKASKDLYNLKVKLPSPKSISIFGPEQANKLTQLNYAEGILFLPS